MMTRHLYIPDHLISHKYCILLTFAHTFLLHIKVKLHRYNLMWSFLKKKKKVLKNKLYLQHSLILKLGS